MGEFLGVIEQLSAGKGTVEDVGNVVGKMFTNLKNYAMDTFTEIGDIYEKSKIGLQTSENSLLRTAGNVIETDKNKIMTNNNTNQIQNLSFIPEVNKLTETKSPTATETTKNEKVYVNGELDLNIKVDAPSSMDRTQLNNIINSVEFREKLIKIIDNAKTSDGQLSPK